MELFVGRTMENGTMKQLVIAAAALLLAGCDSESSGSFETEDGGHADYTIDEATGEVTAAIETADGAASIRSGDSVPVELPQGFSIYPEARIVSNTVFEQSDSSGALVTMETEAGAEDMTAFYRDQAEAAGVEIELDVDTDTMRMIGGKARDGSSFSFTATRSDGNTTGQLMVGEAFR